MQGDTLNQHMADVKILIARNYTPQLNKAVWDKEALTTKTKNIVYPEVIID